jgi:hypothetical protein
MQVLRLTAPEIPVESPEGKCIPLEYDTNGEDDKHHTNGSPILIISRANESALTTVLTGKLQGLVNSNSQAKLPPEPKTLKEAMSGPHAKEWKKALDLEYNALLERQTWELTELPPGRRAVGVKWVFKVKTNAAGELEKFKARLVAKGYSQVKGIDFNDTYAPVSRFTTFCTLMAIAAAESMHVKQLDVKNAFLYGDLEETEIYMQQPEGYEDGTSRVCHLIKSLYGLKQAPLVWYENLESFLLAQGWLTCDSDWALFRTGSDDKACWLLLYVDDILIFSKSLEEVTEAMNLLISQYNMHEEKLQKYLGINIAIDKSNEKIELGLTRYVKAVQTRYNIEEGSRQLHVPLTLDPNLEEFEDGRASMSKTDIKDYQARVGSLMFAASTLRPDIQLACSKLAQGNKAPSTKHVDQMKRAIRYLVDTATTKFVYSKKCGLHLQGYSDANYNRTGTSQSGYIFMLAGGPISWASKKQSAPTLSSTEAELVAAVSCGQEAIYLRRLLKELGHEQFDPTPIYIDNSAVLDLTKTEKRLGNSKHFNRLAWLRHMVKEKILKLILVPSAQQAADFLTKVLPRRQFQSCCNISHIKIATDVTKDEEGPYTDSSRL